ncbi:PEP-CTERM sorting domain-containing protein [Gammaproteobacteria bacterium]|nr:PEP-CTERM sorting domain-containing protein [Gammaproteobacteria bacterium]
MKKILGAIALFLVSATANATPIGAEYVVDESNDPLVLSFTGLTGSLTFDYFFETDWNNSGAWDVSIYKNDLNSAELDRIYILANSSDWTRHTLNGLSGDQDLYIIIDDYGTTNTPTAYFRDFSSTPTYLSGGEQLAPVPAPPAIWLFGVGLLGLIGFSKRRKAT